MKFPFLILILFQFSISIYAQEIDNYEYKFENPEKNFPIKTGFVNDYVNLLSETDQDSLELKLAAYSNKSSHSIILVIVRDISPYSNLIDYTNDLSNHWKVDDRAVFLTIGLDVKDIRIKSSTENLDKLSISFLDDIVQKTLIPNFNLTRFYTGIDSAINQIIETWGDEKL